MDILLEFLTDGFFPIIGLAIFGIYFLLSKKEKRKFANELSGEFSSNAPVVPINPAFVEASTRMIKREEEPTDQFADDVISNIQTVLVIHCGTMCSQVRYDNPLLVIQTNHGIIECLIRKSDFVLRKGDKEYVSELNIKQITHALKQIGVLKGGKGKKQLGRAVFVLIFLINMCYLKIMFSYFYICTYADSTTKSIILDPVSSRIFTKNFG